MLQTDIAREIYIHPLQIQLDDFYTDCLDAQIEDYDPQDTCDTDTDNETF
jgi:hypothetical protein